MLGVVALEVQCSKCGERPWFNAPVFLTNKEMKIPYTIKLTTFPRDHERILEMFTRSFDRNVVLIGDKDLRNIFWICPSCSRAIVIKEVIQDVEQTARNFSPYPEAVNEGIKVLKYHSVEMTPELEERLFPVKDVIF